jgi:D-cysteine desulfhydrase family pyridoxal phosphate-dependent enzyme
MALAHLPTRLEPMDRLGATLGFPAGGLLVKRDDLTGLAGGGNKARKLELLCKDAVDSGCDTLVTGGGKQSNHVRMTAAAASALGLECTVVLAAQRPDEPTGNVVLDELFAPDIVWAGDLDYFPLEERIAAEAERVRARGHRPYTIPIGGASTLGALAYALAVDELLEQASDVDLVVVADGSGGTHAGVAAGFGDHAKVLGVDVGTRPNLVDAVPQMAASVARELARPAPRGDVRLDRDRFGAGYGAPTDASLEALTLTARLEGIVLDPVYTGKAMAGLIAAVREGRVDATRERVVFLHTGGMPALFSGRYSAWIRSASAAGGVT